MNLPFKENIISDNVSIREFSQDTRSEEFVWHRDVEHRIIEPLYDTNWMIQIDNNLPILIDKKILIPKGIYHRLIKGTNNLKITIYKIK